MVIRHLRIFVLALLPLVAGPAWAFSAAWAYSAHLPAPAGTTLYGGSIALKGKLGLVGSSYSADLFRPPPPNTPLPPHLWLHVQHFVPQPGSVGLFGQAVVIDTDRLAIGAPIGDPQLVNNGFVDIYERTGSTWGFVQKVIPTAFDVPPPNHPEVFFGDRLALAGDTLIVGAQHFGDTAGRVFVFERNGGSFQQTQQLKPAVDVRETAFGSAVLLSGDTLAIGRGGQGGAGGTMGQDEPLVPGEVHVYVRSNGVWVLQQVLLAPDSALADEFGRSLDLHADRLVVRSRFSVYLFVRSGGVWSSAWQHALPSGASPRGGVALRPSGSWGVEDDLFVGDPNVSLRDGPSGAGRVLRYTGAANGPGFVFHSTLTDPAPTTNAHFGRWLAGSEGLLMVNAPSGVPGEARVRVFSRRSRLVLSSP